MCLVTPGFVPNTLVAEIVINQEGDFVVPCLGGIFCHGTIVKETMDYTVGNSINTVVIFHDLSIPINPAREKTFVLVPVSCIRSCRDLDDETLHFFSQLLEAYVPNCEPSMLRALTLLLLPVAPIILVDKTSPLPADLQVRSTTLSLGSISTRPAVKPSHTLYFSLVREYIPLQCLSPSNNRLFHLHYSVEKQSLKSILHRFRPCLLALTLALPHPLMSTCDIVISHPPQFILRTRT